LKKLIVLLPVAFILTAYSQPRVPYLRIETGMHTSKCNKIATDTAGKYLLTCSDDKTARFWNASTGALLKTFRIPIVNITNEGKLFACALSPDGKMAAIAGNTGSEWDKNYCVYLVSTQTGAIIRQIKGFTNVIFDLEYSPDGRCIAAGLGGINAKDGTNGVRIIDTAGWTVKTLEGYSYSGDVFNLAFKPGGGLATVCYDGKIRLYNNRFEPLAEKNGFAGKKISSLAFNPSGTLLAVGYSDTVAVEVRNGSDLSPLYEPVVGKKEIKNGLLDKLSFSADGSILYGGGSFNERDKDSIKYIIRCWKDSGRGSFTDKFLMNNIITDMKPLPGGSLAVVGSYPDIGVIDSTRKISWYLSAGNNDYRATDKSHLMINPGGSSIGFTPLKQVAYSFDVLKRKLSEDKSHDPAPATDFKGTTVSNWQSKPNPAINGKKFELRKNENCRSADISSDGNQIILGADFSLYLSDSKANMKWRTVLPSEAFAVNISGNDSVVVAALGNGTIRWYHMKDGKELLAFFLLPDKKGWVLFTTSGYYDASPGAEDFLGWHINNGPDKAADFYPASRFRDQFYRPDIIDSIFKTYDENKAIKAVNHSEGKPENQQQKIDITQKLPPVISIISPDNSSMTSNDTINITFNVSSPANAPAKKIKVLLNGRPSGPDSIVITDTTRNITVNIPREDCTITLLAVNENGTSPEANLSLKWKEPEEQIKAVPGDSVKAVVEKPTLYILAIGVSAYNNESYKLMYAAKDAKDFSSALKKQKGLLYEDVVDSVLTDKEATVTNIKNGLKWIEENTGKNDVAIIFFSGHGYSEKNVYYMLPVEADIYNMRSTCLNFLELKQTQSSIEGKVIVVIDACHSGDLMSKGQNYINGLANFMTSTVGGAGAITFTSSTGTEKSLEQPELNNGVFTKALIEGLTDESSVNEDKEITYLSLSLYITRRVKKLTDNKQHPTCVPTPNTPDFPVAKKQ
jgi:WD40 repeat protein